MNNQIISEWNKKYNYAKPEDILKFAFENIDGEFVLSNSTSIEDQYLTFLIVENKYPCTFFTLDTGRLPEETYETLVETDKLYGIKTKVFFPDYIQVEEMLSEHDVNLFYESYELRKKCCNIRKTQPLQRALNGKAAWITGLRREQSITRINIPVFDYDPKFDLVKINPIADLREKDVWDLVEKNNIPINPLQRKGFRSFGCLPCTRPVSASDDVRAGRWWWEDKEKKECGIHKR